MTLTKGRTRALLAAAILLFALRMSFNVMTPLRSCDEAMWAAAAVRVVKTGGPLYGNALVEKPPVLLWLMEAVFRVCGAYNMVALRIAAVAWWAATAGVLYAAARALMGRIGSVAAAAIFLSAAMNPGFQELRAETLTSLPLATAVALCAIGTRRHKAWHLLLAGAAVALGFLTKQQAGLALPALALWPVVAWAWRRREESLWAAARASALVVLGFVAAVGAVGALFALQGAWHEFFYATWSYNWAFLRAATPAAGYLPSVPYLWGRICRYVGREPFLALALVGAAVGLAWRGPAGAEDEPFPRQARAACLALLLAFMWLAASPADIPAISARSYVSYSALLHVPMCLLTALCIDAIGRADGGRRLLAAAVAGLVVAYAVIPAGRPADSALFHLGLYLRLAGWWPALLTMAAVGAAGWLLDGRWGAWLAPAAFACLYLLAPRSMGSEGAHLPAALAIAALGVLWQAGQRRSLALAALAGVVHAAACGLDWLPRLGLALGEAGWLLSQRSVSRGDRWALAGVYLVPVALGAFPVAEAVGLWRPPLWMGQPLSVHALLTGWLLACRFGGALALGGVLIVARRGGGFGASCRQVLEHPLGLLVLAGLGALLIGNAPASSSAFLAELGLLSALAAALALRILAERRGPPPGARASALLAGAGATAALAAAAVALNAPAALTPTETRRTLAEAIEPGSDLYVWGSPHETEIYVRARAVPAAPQIFTWMLEGVGPTLPRAGPYARPPVATLDGLDRHLAEELPRYVLIARQVRLPKVSGGPAPNPADFPRFGPILRTRYRLVKDLPEAALYQLTAPDP